MTLRMFNGRWATTWYKIEERLIFTLVILLLLGGVTLVGFEISEYAIPVIVGEEITNK